MNVTQRSLEVLQFEYGTALGGYLRRKSETELQKAYELGRRAMAGGLGMLDMVTIHQKSVEAFVNHCGSHDEAKRTIQEASVFLAESLGSFEMTHLGFREALAVISSRTAQLETINKSLNAEIKKRLSVEVALRESQERYRSLVENARDMIYTLSRHGSITSLNPAFEDLTGWKRDEWLGKPFEDLLDPEGLQHHREIHRQLLAGHQPPLFELTIRQKSGNLIIAEFIVTAQFQKGELHGILGFARDITERRNTDMELRGSQARLAEAQRIARIGNWQWNVQDNVLIWSPELYRIFGADPHSPTPRFRSYLAFVHPDDRWMVVNVVGGALKRLEEFEVIHRIVSTDGAVRVVRATGKVGRDNGEQFIRMFGVCQDITEAQRAEEALKELPNKILQAQENERGRLSRELHDDICQRLSALRLGIDIMEHEAGGNRGVMEKIRATKDQIDMIIKDVRRISWNLRPAMLDDLGLATALQRLCDGLNHDHAIKAKLKTWGTLPPRFENGVDIALFRIAQEALSNTVKHAAASRVAVELACHHKRIRLSVSDNGRGFNSFEEHQQDDGHGLGLRSMKERVNLHHGNFLLFTGLTKGTTIVAEIPLGEGHDPTH